MLDGPLSSRWKNFIKRVLYIRAGEFRRVRLMLLNVFLLIQCIWIIKPVVNAQFLLRVGIEKLPLVFLLVALTALIVSTAYSRLLNRIRLDKIMFRTYMISILFFLCYTILLHLDLFGDWMIYLSFIGVALFSLITTSQFWLLGNLVFGSLEAKRLFGLLGAGAIAGGISGGYVTSVLAPLMDSKNLLFLAISILIINMGVNHRIWETCVPVTNASIKTKTPTNLYETPLKLIRNSKHLTYLALIIGISVVVAKLIEFQFSAIASERFSDPNQLTAFFGFWFSTSNAVSLGIQLLITQRLVRFLGVGRSLFILPGALFAGAAVVLNAPVLWAGTALKLFDISLKQSINKAATELVIMPIPMAIKSQVKTFIDVFVDATATGIGGLMLIFLVNGFNLSVRAVCIMILVFICIWIFFVFRIRNEYVRVFQDKLGLRQTPKKKDLLADPAEIGKIRQTLQSGSTKRILSILEDITKSKDPRLIGETIHLLTHRSVKIRQTVLRCLYYHPDPSINSLIEPLLKDPDDEVRFRAFSCLLVHTQHSRVGFINDYLNDKDPAISGAALVGLATEARDNPALQKQFNLENILQDKIKLIGLIQDKEEEKTAKITMALAIGYGKLENFYSVLEDYMHDNNNPAVVRQAITSAGHSQHRRFIKLLLGFLSDKTMRSFAHKALAHYNPLEILPFLTKMSNEKGVLDEILIQLAALAETMDAQSAIDFLFDLIQHRNPAVKLKAILILHKMKLKYPHLSVGGKQILSVLMEEADLYRDTLKLSYALQHRKTDQEEALKIIQTRSKLIHLLERRLDGILQRIFWLLGLTYPPGTILPLYKDLRNMDPNIRINTVELLDNILEPSLKKVVIPILEIAMLETFSDDVLTSLQLVVPTEVSCFESLLKGKDEQIKMAVLSLIEALDNPEYTHLIQIADIGSSAEKLEKDMPHAGE